MRLDRACLIFATALAVASVAGPVLAETSAAETPLRLPLRADARAFEPAFRFAGAPSESGSTLRFTVRERLDLVLSGGKDKSLGESPGRRAEGSAGRSPAPKVARVGIRFQW